jgi:hypothetical protein
MAVTSSTSFRIIFPIRPPPHSQFTCSVFQTRLPSLELHTASTSGPSWARDTPLVAFPCRSFICTLFPPAFLTEVQSLCRPVATETLCFNHRHRMCRISHRRSRSFESRPRPRRRPDALTTCTLAIPDRGAHGPRQVSTPSDVRR